jgi:ADP-heptose:LPS heptosyltransferase
MDFYSNRIIIKSLNYKYNDVIIEIKGNDEIIYLTNNNIENGYIFWYEPTRQFSDFNYITVNIRNDKDIIITEFFRIKSNHGVIIKPISVWCVNSIGMGDYFAATPLIRKLYNAYIRKIDVYCYPSHFEVIKNNKYVNSINSVYDFDIETIKNNSDCFQIFDHHSNAYYYSDLRQLVANKAGMSLKEEEMEYDYIPDKYKLIENLPDKYVCLNPRIAGIDRSWEKHQWQELIDKLNADGIYVVTIGKTDFYNLDIKLGIDIAGNECQNDLSQTWHVINKSKIFVGFDTGVYILAGSTNAHIVLLGWYGDPYYHQPIRNGSRNYKFSQVRGNCDVHCLTDPIFDVNEHGTLKIRHEVWQCMLNKNFICKPDVDSVYNEIKKLYIE